MAFTYLLGLGLVSSVLGLTNLALFSTLHKRADKSHRNPHQGNQELLVVKDKVFLVDPQVSLGYKQVHGM